MKMNEFCGYIFLFAFIAMIYLGIKKIRSTGAKMRSNNRRIFYSGLNPRHQNIVVFRCKSVFFALSQRYSIPHSTAVRIYNDFDELFNNFDAEFPICFFCGFPYNPAWGCGCPGFQSKGMMKEE